MHSLGTKLKLTIFIMIMFTAAFSYSLINNSKLSLINFVNNLFYIGLFLTIIGALRVSKDLSPTMRESDRFFGRFEMKMSKNEALKNHLFSPYPFSQKLKFILSLEGIMYLISGIIALILCFTITYAFL